MDIMKYPRTQHLQGSRLQVGDHDLSQVAMDDILDHTVVIEEKLDGANTGIRFDQGQLMLQSRGHFLTGGPREKHFALFKTWAYSHQQTLWDILGNRYQMYGEWLYAKHTVYYDALPHYFLEFDIYDLEQQCWLDTATRHRMLAGSPVVSVPVLAQGLGRELLPITRWLAPSHYQTEHWEDVLAEEGRKQGLDPERLLAETFQTRVMEGLYLKLETAGQTVGRLKWVHPGFQTTILDSGTHWLDRPIVANGLADGVDLFHVTGGA